jgi:hypothetical protein
MFPQICQDPSELFIDAVNGSKILSCDNLHLRRPLPVRHIGPPLNLKIAEFLIIPLRHQFIGKMGRIIRQKQGKRLICLSVLIQIFQGFVRLILRRPFPRTDLLRRIRPVVGIQVVVAGPVRQPVVKPLPALPRRRVGIPVSGSGLRVVRKILFRRIQMPFPDVGRLIPSVF